MLITGLIREHFSVDPLREELTLGFCTAKELHTRYLICLYHVYSTLEAALDQQASHPALAAVYNPATLARASKLEDDIRYFLALQPGQDWKEHPQARISHWPREIQIALGDYVDRIQVLTAALPNDQQDKQLWAYPPPSASIDLLLSHAYVRYMGDMSGGQEIRKSIAAAYSLPLDLPDGQRFYEFGPKGCDGKEIRQIKRDFREGLDRAGQELSPQAYGTLSSHLICPVS